MVYVSQPLLFKPVLSKVLLHQPQPKWTIYKEDYCYVHINTEPTSVLDSRRSPNSSTMSFSLGSNNTISKWGRGGGSTTCYTPSVSQVALETSLEKCGGRVRMEGYEG
ncbi:hypothetical protein JHK85_001727 [Glycine max]|nr:hypothetical protein JHK85_001727 [Glycine max]KAG5089075.1 hypothetical protein JHK86_001687 [Glycine max]